MAGQVQGVRQGVGTLILPDGTINVDASSVVGLVRTNNTNAYNAYEWPTLTSPPAAGTFLQSDGTGKVTWVAPSGTSVVTVQTGAPTPADVGELWFDCATGSLNVYQNCVGSPTPNWFNVGQPGLPVLPTSTTANPAFANAGTPNAGTSTNPYDCTVTTTAAGSSVFIVNRVTVTGLAPYQYVPIVDLSAVANGGRFSFSNNYADASGILIFDTIFKDQPALTPPTSYTAAIKVGYASAYIDAIVNVVTPVSLTSPGTITGTPEVGATLTYTPGTAINGVGPYVYTWDWRKLSDGSIVQSGTGTSPQTYVVPLALLGDNLYVDLLVTDSVGGTDTGTTSLVPTPPATIQQAPITAATAPTTIPGTSSFTWADGSGNLSATGCIEFKVGAGSFTQSSTAVANTNVITTQWKTGPAGTCGDAPHDTTITGTLTDGTRTSSFSLKIDKLPDSFSFSPSSESTTPSTLTTANPGFTLSGTNAPVYIWGVLAGGGSGAQYTVNNGANWFTIPTTPGTATVDPGANVKVRYTTGPSNGTETLTLNVGESAAVSQSGVFTVNVAAVPFPSSGFTPAGAPNASPASVNTGTLFGTASCSNWQDGSTTLTSTGGIVFDVNATGTFGDGPTPINPGNTIDLIWDPAVISTAVDGAILNGTLTNGVYTNTYTLTVTRGPVTGLNGFVDLTNQPLSSPVTSAIVTPGGFNVPVPLTFAGTTADPLNPVNIDSGSGFNSSPQTVNPGSTLQIQGTTGPNNSTNYGVDITMGSGPAVNDNWQAETIPASPAVTTPTIQSPGNNTTGISTTVNVTGSGYIASGAAGTHLSSDWEVYKGSYPLTSTNQITNVSSSGGTNSWVYSVSNLQSASTLNCQRSYNGYTMQGSTNGFLAWSSNGGATWNPAGIGTGFTSSVNDIAWTGGNTWVAVGGAGRIGRSTDNGANWFQVGSPTFLNASPTAVACDTSTGIVVATLPLVAGFEGVSRSTDYGVNWALQTVPPAMRVTQYSIEFANGLFVVAAAGGTIFTSPDGATWTQRTSPDNTAYTQAPNAIAYGNGTWVIAVRTSTVDQIWRSTDNAVTWSAVTVTTYPNSVAFGNGFFYTNGNSGGSALAYSADGVTWSTVTINNSVDNSNVTAKLSYDSSIGRLTGANSYSSNPIGTTTLTITGCATDGFAIGDKVVSDPGAAASGTITAVSNASVSVTPSSASWSIGQYIKRNPSSYTQIVPPPANPNTSNLTTLPLSGLSSNSPYYSRVRYTSNPTTVTSGWSPWSKFTTA